MPSLPGITGEQESTRARPTVEPGTAAAKLPDTLSTRGDDMPEIEVGDLVQRKTTGPPVPNPRVYLVTEVEKREHSDGRPILDPHGRPSWCKLHGDGDKLTAVKSLTVVLKARR